MNKNYDIVLFDLSDILLNSYTICLENSRAIGKVEAMPLIREALRNAISRAEKIIAENLIKEGRAHIITAGLSKLLDLQNVALEVTVRSRDTVGYFEAAALILVDILLAKGSPWSVSETWPIQEFIKEDTKILIISRNMTWGSSIDKNHDWNTPYGNLNIEKFKEIYGFIPTRKKIMTYKSFIGKSEYEPKLLEIKIEKDILLKCLENFNGIEEIGKKVYSLKGVKTSDKDSVKLATANARINKRMLLKQVDIGPENEIVYGKYDLKILNLWDKVLDPASKTIYKKRGMKNDTLNLFDEVR